MQVIQCHVVSNVELQSASVPWDNLERRTPFAITHAWGVCRHAHGLVGRWLDRHRGGDAVYWWLMWERGVHLFEERGTVRPGVASQFVGYLVLGKWRVIDDDLGAQQHLIRQSKRAISACGMMMLQE